MSVTWVTIMVHTMHTMGDGLDRGSGIDARLERDVDCGSGGAL